MNLPEIIVQLKLERDRLTRAIAALEGSQAGAINQAPRRRRGITPAGRRRLSQMMKKRWAERRKKA